MTPDISGHNKGELAKSVKMDESGKKWTVTLRDNIQWSDGEKITADDLIYTVDLIRDTTAKTTISADFSRVKTVKIDDLTVEFQLPSTYIDFDDTLEFPLVPKHILGDLSPALVYESDFSTKPVGSVKTYKKREDIIEALNSSEATATAELGIEMRDKLNKNISLRESLLNGGAFAFFNMKSDQLKNKSVRQAIRQGIDMNKIREGLSDAQILDYPILARQESLTYPDMLKSDVNEAKELLTKAGYKYGDDGKLQDKEGKAVTLNAVVQKRDTLTGIAERFVEELKALGFEVTLNIYDESQTTSDFFSTVVRPREYDILFYEVDLGVSADPLVYYSSTQMTAGGWNFSNYSNSLVDDSLLSAHTTTSQDVRKAKYEYFLKTWVADVPAVGLYQSSLKYYYDSSVSIYSDNMLLPDALDRFNDVRHWASVKQEVNSTP